MNQKASLFIGLLLAIPSIVNANEAYTIQCETMPETECTVTSANHIRSVRVEIYPGGNNSPTALVDREFRNCPTEVSVSLDSMAPGVKFFVETCDGSNGIKTIGPGYLAWEVSEPAQEVSLIKDVL
ncbi:MAG: hypothetical protein ACL93V_11295 [Candidatus Electrothrix sp. YB6]